MFLCFSLGCFSVVLSNWIMMDIGVIFITNLVLEFFLDSRIYELKIFIKFGFSCFFACLGVLLLLLDSRYCKFYLVGGWKFCITLHNLEVYPVMQSSYMETFCPFRFCFRFVRLDWRSAQSKADCSSVMRQVPSEDLIQWPWTWDFPVCLVGIIY